MLEIVGFVTLAILFGVITTLIFYWMADGRNDEIAICDCVLKMILFGTLLYKFGVFHGF
jgi:hypothetical protein